MGFPLDLWPAWLLPDDQAGDPYQWAVVASGHVMLGAIVFSAAAWLIGHRAAAYTVITGYLAIEAVQLFLLGGTLTDGLTDAFFVIGGMVMGDEAMRKQPDGFMAMLVFMALGIFVGVVIRL